MSTATGFQAVLRAWLYAVRDSFVIALPVTMMIVIVVVLLNIPSEAYQAAMVAQFGPEWKAFGLKVYAGTAGVMALTIAVITALRLNTLRNPATSTREEGQALALLTIAGFVATVSPVAGSLDSVFGYANVLLGIFVGIATLEFFWLYSRLTGARDAGNFLGGSLLLQNAVRWIVPGVFTLLSVVLLASAFRSMGEVLLIFLGQQVQSVTGGNEDLVGVTYAYLFIEQLFWMVGIHGSNVLQAAFPTYLTSDTSLLSDGKIPLSLLNSFVHLGGAGVTAGVIAALLIKSREKDLRRLAWVSLLPAVFNVNELLIFGLPIVFSRYLLVPFLTAPLVAYSITLLAQYSGFLVLEGQAVPWSTPMLLSGYLVSGGWSGVVVQLVTLSACTALYWPFLAALQRKRKERQAHDIQQAIGLIGHSSTTTESFLNRPDTIGSVCRAMLTDFERDLGTPRVCLYFQGKHDADGRLLGAEALLRWQHHEHGTIPPFAIVQLAEESGMIHALGMQTIEQTFEAIVRWRNSGTPTVKISVNVSPVQLEDPDFVVKLQQLMTRYAISVKEFDLEITEGRAISSNEQSDTTLRALAQMGISLSMDDFGMGCTSLLYLQRFDVSSIKLDGVLTRHVLTNRVSADIVKTICDLGREQRARIVAEFVETREQQDRLVALGCDEFQGYLHSKPMPESAFADLLRGNRSSPALA